MGDNVNSFDEIKRHLPQFLTSVDQKALFSEVDSFLSSRNLSSGGYYSDNAKFIDNFCQGDGVNGLSFVDLRTKSFKNKMGMLISNTCDMDPSNARTYPTFVSYCPVHFLDVYRQALIDKGINTQKVRSHIDAIKNQKDTSFFYLPNIPNIGRDGVVYFGQINSCPREMLDEGNVEKIFQLSNVGFYLFLIKLSIHFTRIRDGVNRGEGNESADLISCSSAPSTAQHHQ